MIKEEYVSFEVARLLNDKGFNEPTIGTYNIESKNPILVERPIRAIHCEAIISAPTQAMAMMWLREVHNLCLFVIPATIDETFRTGYALYPQCDSKWEWCASKNDRSKATFGLNINRKYCDSYEQACETAIKYCLENLI